MTLDLRDAIWCCDSIVLVSLKTHGTGKISSLTTGEGQCQLSGVLVGRQGAREFIKREVLARQQKRLMDLENATKIEKVSDTISSEVKVMANVGNALEYCLRLSRISLPMS